MEPKYINISDLNRYLKAKFDLDKHLNKVYLKGEISNYKHHTRGHLYFTLKDETSRISAVMFSTNARNLKFKPEDGMSVLITGRIAIYEANGTYQIYVEEMQLDGIGNLHLLFEQLKEKLHKEGLFAQSIKKPIPKYPDKIGVITAPTGAAVRDIISTINRRYPLAEVILFPALVQGDNASTSIVKQIESAQNYDLDVLIVGRGGGSIEDLWSFNEEIVARAIYKSNVPIISAVGHEPDVTISDYVADLRAPTPTGAAEMAVPNISDVLNIINQFNIRANETLKNKININQKKLDNIINSYILKNPLSLYEIKEQKLDNYIDKLNVIINNKLVNYQTRYNNIIKNNILKNPLYKYKDYENIINLLKHKSNTNITNIINNLQYKLNIDINTLELVNPISILGKGYSIVYHEDKIIKNTTDIKKDDIISIKLEKGQIKAKVSEVNNGK